MKPEETEYITYFPEEESLSPAGAGARAANYILDRLIYLSFMVVIYLNPGRLMEFDPKEDKVIWFCISMAYLLIYFTLFEYFTGRTPAKFLTGTKVLTEDGGEPSFVTILIRTLCRMIPFNQLSIFFFKRPWHDSLSKTMVVNYKPAISLAYLPFAIIMFYLAIAYFTPGRPDVAS